MDQHHQLKMLSMVPIYTHLSSSLFLTLNKQIQLDPTWSKNILNRTQSPTNHDSLQSSALETLLISFDHQIVNGLV